MPEASEASGGVGRDSVRVFVSYRRDDVPDATDRLVASLIRLFGEDRVSLDVDSVEDRRALRRGY